MRITTEISARAENNLEVFSKNTEYRHWHFNVSEDSSGLVVKKSGFIASFFKYITYLIPFFEKAHRETLNLSFKKTLIAIEPKLENSDGASPALVNMRIIKRFSKDAWYNLLFKDIDIKLPADPRWEIESSAEAIKGAEFFVAPNLIYNKGLKSFFYRRSVRTFLTPKAGEEVWEEGHFFKGIQIGLSIQLKRIARLCTAFHSYKYFSRNETDKDIYAENRLPRSIFTGSEVRIQHIGHATQLIQTKGMNILVDPVFYGLNFLICPRKTDPSCRAKDLPPIDVILISHDHRDHLDKKTLKEFLRHQPFMLVPTDTGHIFESIGFLHVYEHSWWQQSTFVRNGHKVTIAAVPADHWSGRNGHDAYESLTLGWVIDEKVYDACDTALFGSKWISQVKRLFPRLEANIQSAGPNFPRHLMQSTHQSFTESLKMHMMLMKGNGLFLIKHHNTFELGTDRFNEAVFIRDAAIHYLKMVQGLENHLEEENQRSHLIKQIQDLPDFAKADIDYLLDEGYTAEHLIKVLEGTYFPKIGDIVTV